MWIHEEDDYKDDHGLSHSLFSCAPMSFGSFKGTLMEPNGTGKGGNKRKIEK